MAIVATTGGSLSVIALISGGKDSFYSILHCQANGHRVVALANLYPSSGTVEEEEDEEKKREKKTAARIAQYQTKSRTQPQPQRQSQSRSRASSSSSSLSSRLPLSPSQQQADHNESSSVPQRQVPSSRLEPASWSDGDEDGGETDLNSFMYQTVGHQVIPLYARATGLPLHRQPIVGTAVHHGLSYENPRRHHGARGSVALDGSVLRPSAEQLSPATGDLRRGGYDAQRAHVEEEKEHEPEVGEDETESLVPLLRAVMQAHPEANALCTGAILSTYQRTRVESVALRLGLVPLSYLWQFTELPASIPKSDYEQCFILGHSRVKQNREARKRAKRNGRNPGRDDARLLLEMAAVGLEARMVKVASAGLDERFLWENVASEMGVQRIAHAMRRFGAADGRGAILGEGGEFETLVVDGPPSLFKGRIVMSEEDRRVVHEGGGCAWLSFRRADVVLKDEPEQAGELSTPSLDIQTPRLLDPRFEDVGRCLLAVPASENQKPGIAGPSLCCDSTRPAFNFGSTSSPFSVTQTDSPTSQPPSSRQTPSVQEWCYFGSDEAGSLTVEKQTLGIVDQIRRRLRERGLPTTAITNSVIVLRHMSDFPLINEHYGSLFDQPNPPSRVTISCGGLLPRGAAVAIYLSVQIRLESYDRRGLHVQSRSYWAPANIGPYSQAIAFPLLPRPIAGVMTGGCCADEDEPQRYSDVLSSSPFAVSIAGQIPLIPASMALPPSSVPHSIELQIILALQHLWRVGTEMQVRWWTSAVAYFPTASSTETMKQQAFLAASAWKAAHMWPDLVHDDEGEDGNDTSDDDGAGPDLWDRRYNAQYVTYGGNDEEESFPLPLPKWGALRDLDVDDDDTESLWRNKAMNIPFFFAAEVEELPRQACVEWHAHLGLADVQPKSITLHSAICDKLPSELRLRDLNLHYVAVHMEDAVFIQTTATLRSPADHSDGRGTSISTDMLHSLFVATAASLGDLLNLSSSPSMNPKITYASGLELAGCYNLEEMGALIPCHSLWDAQGHRLDVVSIFETRVAKAKKA